MDIYQAIADFTPPKTATSQNILTFTKGDKFEIFDCHKQTDWWGARSLKDSSIGYVPSKYMQVISPSLKTGEGPFWQLYR